MSPPKNYGGSSKTTMLHGRNYQIVKERINMRLTELDADHVKYHSELLKDSGSQNVGETEYKKYNH